MAYTLDQYVQNTTHENKPYVETFGFANGNKRMLEVNFGIPASTGQVLSHIWIKRGSMVAYRGDIDFRLEGIAEHGFGNMFKKALTEEGMTLTKASCKGRGQLFLAENSRHVQLFRLQGDSIVVNGSDILALEPTVEYSVKMMKSVSSIISGGLFNVVLKGHGIVAIMTHGRPITLLVRAGEPDVYTDPQATVAWSGALQPELKTNVQLKTFVGRSSGESLQMKFNCRAGPGGFVLVQPHEEKPENR